MLGWCATQSNQRKRFKRDGDQSNERGNGEKDLTPTGFATSPKVRNKRMGEKIFLKGGFGGGPNPRLLRDPQWGASMTHVIEVGDPQGAGGRDGGWPLRFAARCCANATSPERCLLLAS